MRPSFLTALAANASLFPCFDGDDLADLRAQQDSSRQPLLPQFSCTDYNPGEDRQNLLMRPLASSAPDSLKGQRETAGNSEMSTSTQNAGSPSESSPRTAESVCGHPSRKTRGTETPQQRAERIERIRREIELGIYDTPERFEAACERLFQTFPAGD